MATEKQISQHKRAVASAHVRRFERLKRKREQLDNADVDIDELINKTIK